MNDRRRLIKNPARGCACAQAPQVAVEAAGEGTLELNGFWAKPVQAAIELKVFFAGSLHNINNFFQNVET